MIFSSLIGEWVIFINNENGVMILLHCPELLFSILMNIIHEFQQHHG